MRITVRRATIAALAAATAAIALSACQSEGAPAPAPAVEASPMIKRSLMSLGDTARIKAVMKKAKAGQEVIVAAIGGSITEGAGASEPEKCWAYLSYLAFKSAYGKGDGSNVKFVNAGMGGTPSTLGMIRLKRDVIDRAGRMPDLVFVEFSVNDGDDPTAGAAYESLVRTILKAPNAPAVVNVFSVFKSRWNLQDRLAPIGEAYALPMVSAKDAVLPELDSGAITNEDYFADIYHPTDRGHAIMAECVSYYFSMAAAAKPGPAAPLPAEPAIGFQFDGVKMATPDNPPKGGSVKAGAFSEPDEYLGSFIYDRERKTFPSNWYKPMGSANDPFVMTLACKNILLVYKKSALSSFGNADVLVDGELVGTYDGSPSGAWNNPWTVVLLDAAESKKHTIEIRMAEGDEDKEFSILAIGYTE